MLEYSKITMIATTTKFLRNHHQKWNILWKPSVIC